MLKTHGIDVGLSTILQISIQKRCVVRVRKSNAETQIKESLTLRDKDVMHTLKTFKHVVNTTLTTL